MLPSVERWILICNYMRKDSFCDFLVKKNFFFIPNSDTRCHIRKICTKQRDIEGKVFYTWFSYFRQTKQKNFLSKEMCKYVLVFQ